MSNFDPVHMSLNTRAQFTDMIHIRACMNKHLGGFMCNIITHPLRNCKGGLTKPPMKLGHEYFRGLYNDIIMSATASQITSLMIVYSTVYSGADQWQHQSSASLAFVREIHRWPVNSLHKRPVTRKIFPFDDVTMDVIIYPCRNPEAGLANVCQ